jgi:hypothetical protein
MSTLYSLGALTLDGYRMHTGDQTSTPATVSGALVEAEQVLEDELRRKLPLQSRTDTFAIGSDGRIYPDAWPITAATGLTIDGRALLGATPDVTTFVGYFPDRPTRATVTWTGGFDDGTLSRLPVVLRHALYDLARGLAQDAAPVPVGATAVSVGDVSISYSAATEGGLDALVPGLSARVRRYRNRFV